MNYHAENDMTEDEQAYWEAKAEEAGKGSGASPCSAHVLLKVRWSISGFCSVEPVAAFTTRKLANAESRRKNEAATTCEYVVKTLKVIR